MILHYINIAISIDIQYSLDYLNNLILMTDWYTIGWNQEWLEQRLFGGVDKFWVFEIQEWRIGGIIYEQSCADYYWERNVSVLSRHKTLLMCIYCGFNQRTTAIITHLDSGLFLYVLLQRTIYPTLMKFVISCFGTLIFFIKLILYNAPSTYNTNNFNPIRAVLLGDLNIYLYLLLFIVIKMS